MASPAGDKPDGFRGVVYKMGLESSKDVLQRAIRAGASKEMALQLGKDMLDIAVEVDKLELTGNLSEPQAAALFRANARKYIEALDLTKPSPVPPNPPSEPDLAEPSPKRPRSQPISYPKETSTSSGSAESFPGVADASSHGHLQDTLAVEELAEHEKLFPSAPRPSVLVSGIAPDTSLAPESPADEVAPESPGPATNVLHKEGGFVVSQGDLVHDRVGAHHRGAVLLFQECDPKARSYVVMRADCELAKLHAFVKQQVEAMQKGAINTSEFFVGYICTSTGMNSSECLLVARPRCTITMKKGRPSEIKVGVYVGTVKEGSSKGSRVKFVRQAIESLGSAEHFRTMTFAITSAEPTPDRNEIKDMLRPYVDFTNEDWESELLAIKLKSECKLALTGAEMLISQHPQQCQRVRMAMKQQQQAMTYVVLASDPDLPCMQESFDQEELSKLKIVVYEPLEGRYMQADFLKGYPHVLYHRALMFHGPPGTGKSPLAKGIAKLTAIAHGKPWFVMTNTIDSLRVCTEAQLFQHRVPCIIDEWVAGVASQDPLATKINFVKVVCDVANTTTLRARYTDIRLPSHTPRIITTQDSREQWMLNLRQMGSEDDVNAVLKRTAWVEVPRSIMKHEAVEAHRKSLQDSGTTAILDLLKGMGLSAESAVQWEPVGPSES